MGVIAMYRQYFDIFGIDKYVMRLSTHHAKGLGKKYIDNERLWLKTEEMVRNAMRKTAAMRRRLQDLKIIDGGNI